MSRTMISTAAKRTAMRRTNLDKQHYEHLISEGFTPEEIEHLEVLGVRSLSLEEVTQKGIKKWNGTRHVSCAGLWMPFQGNYGQVRFNEPIEVGGKKFKYLGPRGAAKAWMPLGFQAITEGFKDAAKPTLLGCPTAAIVGVDNIIHTIPKDCKKPIIFDSDGWVKPQVVRALIKGALWTGGKINLFPKMPEYPCGGACEFFKSGASIKDYFDLIEKAMLPMDFLERWMDQLDPNVLGAEKHEQCLRVASKSVSLINSPLAAVLEMETRRVSKVLARQ